MRDDALKAALDRLDFAEADRLLSEREDESERALRQIILLRVSNALMRGRVDQAEDLAGRLGDRAEADQMIAKWRERYEPTQP